MWRATSIFWRLSIHRSTIELISIFVPLNKLIARDVSSTMMYDIASGCEAEEVFRGYQVTMHLTQSKMEILSVYASERKVSESALSSDHSKFDRFFRYCLLLSFWIIFFLYLNFDSPSSFDRFTLHDNSTFFPNSTIRSYDFVSHKLIRSSIVQNSPTTAYSSTDTSDNNNCSV